MNIDYFPLGLAQGKAFCNRKIEIERLSYNIAHQKPTLLISPRRYGKTSLALNVIQLTDMTACHIDFLIAVDEYSIEKMILHGVGQLIWQLETTPKRIIKLINDFFSELNLSVSFGKLKLSLDIEKNKKTPAENILIILEQLDAVAKKYKKKLVLFFDEFQRLSEITENDAIENGLRHVAQKSRHLTFIFSGSNRHLLHEMFSDRNRAFYRLCDRITLERIQKEHYIPYIQTAAKGKWKKPLEDKTIDVILEMTERHPHYLNALCSQVWNENTLPDDSNIIAIWQRYLAQERSQAAIELNALSIQQRKLLTIIAQQGGTNKPLSQAFALQANMPLTTIAQALQALERKDYIFKDEQGYYQVLDPLLKALLKN